MTTRTTPGIEIRPGASIHYYDGGWFRARWHFSFDFYRDPENMGWGDLRVFNDDILIPGATWPMHPHRDVEGITYVAEGTFEHADSMGNGGVLPRGSLQRITLGSGALHSESNYSKTEHVRFIQMWILPSERGLPPSIEQREYTDDEKRNRLKLLLAPAAGYGGPDAPSAPDAVTVHQDASVYCAMLDAGKTITHRFRDGFGGYLCVVHGSARLSSASAAGGEVDERGAAKIGLIPDLTIEAGPEGAEVLLVETKLR